VDHRPPAPTRSLYDAQDPTNRKPLFVEFAEHVPQHIRQTVEAARSRIDRLRALPSGWDGRQAQQVTDDASRAAILVVAGVAVAGLTAQIFPVPEGGLQVEWHYHDWDLEIEVSDTGELTIFACDEAGQVSFDSDAADVYDRAPLMKARGFLQHALDLHPRTASGVAWR
jgi:hypothetical protein